MTRKAKVIHAHNLTITDSDGCICEVGQVTLTVEPAPVAEWEWPEIAWRLEVEETEGGEE